MAPETAKDKAQRLLDTDGAVRPVAVSDEVATFAVKGDTKSYLVTVLSEEKRNLAAKLGVEPGNCPCEARGVCSHILAANAMWKHLAVST